MELVNVMCVLMASVHQCFHSCCIKIPLDVVLCLLQVHGCVCSRGAATRPHRGKTTLVHRQPYTSPSHSFLVHFSPHFFSISLHTFSPFLSTLFLHFSPHFPFTLSLSISPQQKVQYYKKYVDHRSHSFFVSCCRFDASCSIPSYYSLGRKFLS